MLKRWRFGLGVVISIVFLYLALRGLKLDEAWLAVRTASYWWIIPGVLVYLFAMWVRAWRWHYMLRPIKAMSLACLFPVVIIGYMGNNVYPARAGELIRAYVLRKKEAVSISASLATIIVERIFDGVIMLLSVFVSLPFIPMPEELQRVVILFSLLLLGALAVFFVIAASPVRSQAVYNWFIARLVPPRLQDLVRGLLDRFMDGLHCLRSSRDVLMIFVTSLVIWLTETVKYWFVMHSFDFSVPFYVLMLMHSVVNLVISMPSVPGHVGTFDAPGIEVLEQFGVDRAVATSYTLVLHAALWLSITLLGFYYMGRESVSWEDFGLATKIERERSNP